MDLPFHIGPNKRRLSISELTRSSAGEIYVVFELEAAGLAAEQSIYVPGPGCDGLVTYFAELNAAWRGWPGVKTWESVEGDLRLVARHDGHVHLQTELRGAKWRCQALVTLESGAQLTNVAEGLAAIFS